MKKERKISRIVRKNMKSLVSFEIMYKLVFLLVFIPLTSEMIQLSLNLTGFRYLTRDNIEVYLRHPLTLTCFFILFVMIAYFSLVDLASIVYNIDRSYQKKRTNTVEMIKFGFNKSIKLFHYDNVLFCFFVVFIIPFFSIGIAWCYFRMISFSDLLLEFLKRKIYISIIIGVAVITLWVFFIRWIYCFHYFFLEGLSFVEACKKSSQLNARKRTKDGIGLFLIQLGAAILFALLFGIGIGIIMLITKYVVSKLLVESMTLAIILFYLNVLYLVLIALITPVSFIFISYLFYQHKEEAQEKIIHCERVKVERTRKVMHFERCLQVVILSLSILTGYFYFEVNQTGRMDFNIEYIRKIDVTAHRGASALYPENSMSAFRGAIELDTDWIELDVQQTKDGVIIVMHDTNLLRTTGADKNIWEMTFEDLQNLEIGSWFSTEFTGEPIPTLEEVLLLAKENSVRLNIELKPTGHEVDFEKQVIDLINEAEYKDMCVVTSQVYEVLQNVKAYDEEIKTVYVMSMAYGNVLRLKAADSFSIKHTFVTDKIVSSVHNAGKEIYAWTMNSKYQIDAMIQMNVDNIITDDIPLAQKCIYESKTSNLVIEYIERLLGVKMEEFLQKEKIWQ